VKKQILAAALPVASNAPAPSALLSGNAGFVADPLFRDTAGAGKTLFERSTAWIDAAAERDVNVQSLIFSAPKTIAVLN